MTPKPDPATSFAPEDEPALFEMRPAWHTVYVQETKIDGKWVHDVVYSACVHVHTSFDEGMACADRIREILLNDPVAKAGIPPNGRVRLVLMKITEEQVEIIL